MTFSGIFKVLPVAVAITRRRCGTPKLRPVLHEVVNSPPLQGLEFAKTSFQQGQFSVKNSPKSHGAKAGLQYSMGGAGLITATSRY